ncbi:hypothetical protein NC652_031459 [Populus alba x Populus x berolinensis]|uniref:Uncharacterized protein n=1 Tax=Populus alba x Populus x berolinensis TaxID=444605 RepID=A0AAD6LYD8_9ROSI|nr:hypothetical protein NC652_031459 [Populus alba x Populus x berolinensis]KAJ6975355.1 hypothetical protein NC653_031261 [Populus alba x Populus x berolinensis]
MMRWFCSGCRGICQSRGECTL